MSSAHLYNKFAYKQFKCDQGVFPSLLIRNLNHCPVTRDVPRKIFSIEKEFRFKRKYVYIYGLVYLHTPEY